MWDAGGPEEPFWTIEELCQELKMSLIFVGLDHVSTDEVRLYDELAECLDYRKGFAEPKRPEKIAVWRP